MKKNTKNNAETIETVTALPLADVMANLFPPVKALRSDLSVGEQAAKAALETAGIPLPEAFYTLTVPVEKIREAMAILSTMLPKKGKGGKKAGEPSTADPATGWIASARSRLRTARKQGKTVFATGSRFNRLFPAYGLPETLDPQNQGEYDKAMAAYAATIKAGGSTEQ